MARRRGRRRRGGSRKLPILTLAAVGVGIADAALSANGNVLHGLNRLVMNYTGIDALNRQFVPSQMLVGLGPLVGVGMAKRFLFPIIGRPRLGKWLPVSLS